MKLESLIENNLGVLFNPWSSEVCVQFCLLLTLMIDNLFMSESKQYMVLSIIDCLTTSAAIHPPRLVILSIYDYF